MVLNAGEATLADLGLLHSLATTWYIRKKA